MYSKYSTLSGDNGVSEKKEEKKKNSAKHSFESSNEAALHQLP